MGDKFAIDVRVNQVAGRGDLRPGNPVGEVAAWIRGRRIELKRRQRKVV